MKSSGIRALAVSLSAALMVMVTLAGFASVAADEPLPDPGGPGPFAVGLVQRTFTREASVGGDDRVLQSSIWYPAEGSAADAAPTRDAPPTVSSRPFPIIVFSHGSGDEPDSSSYITAHLASHGFIVVAPPHPGNTS